MDEPWGHQQLRLQMPTSTHASSGESSSTVRVKLRRIENHFLALSHMWDLISNENSFCSLLPFSVCVLVYYINNCGCDLFQRHGYHAHLAGVSNFTPKPPGKDSPRDKMTASKSGRKTLCRQHPKYVIINSDPHVPKHLRHNFCCNTITMTTQLTCGPRPDRFRTRRVFTDKNPGN